MVRVSVTERWVQRKAGNMILFDVGWGGDFQRCELPDAAKGLCCLIPSKVYGSSTIKFAFITYRNCSQK